MANLGIEYTNTSGGLVIFSIVGPISIKIRLKINRERSERKIKRNKIASGHCILRT